MDTNALAGDNRFDSGDWFQNDLASLRGDEACFGFRLCCQPGATIDRLKR